MVRAAAVMAKRRRRYAPDDIAAHDELITGSWRPLVRRNPDLPDGQVDSGIKAEDVAAGFGIAKSTLYRALSKQRETALWGPIVLALALLLSPAPPPRPRLRGPNRMIMIFVVL